MSKIESILFVCTGNSCRSIMAEGLMREALKKLGHRAIAVSSAGTRAMDGFCPTQETIEVMKREGIDVSGFKSKLLTDEMIISSDLILVMAADHIYDIVRRFPEAAQKTFMLRQYKTSDNPRTYKDLDIPDPICKSLEVYEDILGQIKEEVNRIARTL